MYPRRSCAAFSPACPSCSRAAGGSRRPRSRCRSASPSGRSPPCRRSRGSACCCTRSPSATTTSPSASLPRRPTSPSRPTSAPGSTARSIFAREGVADTFKAERIPSTYNWTSSPEGQHVELGIAENNLFILLSALGLSHSLFGERLLPVRHALRSLHRARPRCAELRLLPGRALPAGGDALRRDPGARGRRAPVDRDPADRHGAGRARQLRAGLRRRARGDPALFARLPAARRGRPPRPAHAPAR